ncbi:MAG: hypothetical protein R2744_04090 [Bacteroidales bacterium]
MLIACPLDASPADTLEAWEKAMKIRGKDQAGENHSSQLPGEHPMIPVAVNGGTWAILQFSDSSFI